MTEVAYEGIPEDDIWNIDFSDLEFTNELARGSFGKVFRGTYLGVDVAIKQILRHNDPAYMKYIEREICVLKGIRHPFIVGFCGVCLHDSGLYIVTEFVDGGDVRGLLKTSKPSWHKKLQIASDLAKAMFYLHSKKIIHRDLKSKNLLIGSDGKIRLCDFGFARLSEFGQQRTMTICGTPGFVAPEIMMGEDYDSSCDIFSYGNVLAELITSQRPSREFWNRTVDDNYQLDYDELRRIAPKDVPPKFMDLCLRCVQYKPADRPDFGEILVALKELEADIGKEDGHSGSRKNEPEIGRHETVTLSEEPQHKSGKDSVSYLQAILSRRLQLSSSERVFCSKHLLKMVQRVTSPDLYDSEYTEDLLLTYPCFASPEDFLTAIIERYKNPGPVEDEKRPSVVQKDLEAQAKKQQVTQIRVIVLLKQWIEKYVDDFSEPGMPELVKSFDNQLEGSNVSLEKLLEKAYEKKVQKPLGVSNGRKTLDPLSLVNVNPLELAKQITFMDCMSYKLIAPREFLKDTFQVRSDSAVKIMAERSHHLARWIATVLVKTEKLELRAQLLNKFIETATHLLSLKNFHGLNAVVMGLNHQSIGRLALTWNALKQSVLLQFKSVSQLFSADGNFKNYRTKLESSPSLPLLLFLDPFLEEITYLESSSNDIGKGGIINFQKHRQLARLIRYITSFQASQYDFKSNDTLADLLQNTQILDEDALKKQSLLAEPPHSFIK